MPILSLCCPRWHQAYLRPETIADLYSYRVELHLPGLLYHGYFHGKDLSRASNIQTASSL